MHLAPKQNYCDRLLGSFRKKPSAEEELLLRLVVSCTGEVPVEKIREFITGGYEEIFDRAEGSELLQNFKELRYTVRLRAIIGLRRHLDPR